MSDSWVGRTLGRYQIEAEVGRGGMGVVYRGRQTSLNRTVAIKVLPPQLAADATFRQRFRQEAEVIASLTHENIVSVYDIEEHEGTVFIVMELVEGASARAVRQARRMSPEEVRTIGIAVTRALTCAHVRGIVHRDVKSPNVMLTADGKVKLMDFGIARVIGGGVRTVTGSVLGTPEYMAPEQARSGTVTPQTDLYSLGVVLYELATGQLPFTGGDAFAVALKHISETAPLPRALDPTVPEWLERVILKAMEKDPLRRYASASELERDLLAAGLATSPADAPTVASAVPLVPFTAPPALSNPVASIPARLAAVAAPPPPAAAAASPAPATMPTAVTRVRRPASLAWILLAGAAVIVVGLGIAALVIARSGLMLGGEAKRQPQGAPIPTLPLEQAPSTNEPSSERTEPASEPELEKPVVVTPSGPPPTVTAPKAPPSQANEAPAGGQATAPPAREPASSPRVEPPAEAPPPAPPTSPPVIGLFRCSEAVEFHVSPEDAIVSVGGRRLGKADDLDGMGGNDGWRPSPGSYVACFEHPGLSSACVRIVLDRNAADDTCDVDTDLEDL